MIGIESAELFELEKPNPIFGSWLLVLKARKDYDRPYKSQYAMIFKDMVIRALNFRELLVKMVPVSDEDFDIVEGVEFILQHGKEIADFAECGDGHIKVTLIKTIHCALGIGLKDAKTEVDKYIKEQKDRELWLESVKDMPVGYINKSG